MTCGDRKTEEVWRGDVIVRPLKERAQTPAALERLSVEWVPVLHWEQVLQDEGRARVRITLHFTPDLIALYDFDMAQALPLSTRILKPFAEYEVINRLTRLS